MSSGSWSVFPAPPAPAGAAVPAPPGPSPTARAAALGNRCGHVPGAPRFHLIALPQDANSARPGVILKAIAKIQDYYRRPREGRWDALSQGERARRLAGRGETGQRPPGSAERARLARWRQQRSERREAVVAVLMLLLAYTDIDTLTVAVPRGADWLGLSAPWIAAHTGLSPSRVKRALATLARGGWLAATGQGRHFDRRRRAWVGIGWGPVRRLSFQLVRALGLDVSWAQAQRKAHKAQTRPEAPPSPARATISTALPQPMPDERSDPHRAHARALRQALASPAAWQAETDPAAHQARVERNRRMAELAAQGLSPAEIRQILGDAPQPP